MPLSPDQLALIDQRIIDLDPDQAYVSLHTGHQRVTYSSEIVQHEVIADYTGDEEPCRALIVAWLCTEGGYHPTNIELEKRYSIGRPSSGAELDILVKRPDGTAFLLIEVKAPDQFAVDQDRYIEGQLFGIAPLEEGVQALAFTTVRLSQVGAQIHTICIDYSTHRTFRTWSQNRPASANLPVNYGETVHVHYTNDGDRPLRRDITVRELNLLRKRLHDILWKGSTPDNTIYAYVVKLFLAKIFDEKNTNSGERYRFQIFYLGNRRETPSDTFERINGLYQEAYDRYLSPSPGAVRDSLSNREFSEAQVAFVVELLQGISLSQAENQNADLLGAFFEGITRDGFKQTKGLFFTHINLVLFLMKALQIEEVTAAKISSATLYSDRLPYIIDPSCGSGTFLLAAMSLITQYVSANRSALATNEDVAEFLDTRFAPTHENAWASEYLYGIDDNELLAIASKVNMILRRDGNAHIFKADGLSALSEYTDQRLRGTTSAHEGTYQLPVAETFDIVVSNPPFSITLDPHTSRQLDNVFEMAGERNSENLFLERWYQLLRPGGRLGVVLPESFYSTQENLDARVFLLKHFDIAAIVSLPRDAFQPWTPTRTSLLLARKKSPEAEANWIARYTAAQTRAASAKDESTTAANQLQRIVDRLQEGDYRDRIDGVCEVLTTHGITLEPISTTDSLASHRDTLESWGEALDRLSDDVRAAVFAVRPTTSRDLGVVKRAVGRATESLTLLSSAPNLFRLRLDLPTAQMSLERVSTLVQTLLDSCGAVDERVWAVSQVAAADDRSFPVLSVENIGYKRTRRGESEQPNDLFLAESPEGEQVLNINLATGDWTIVAEPQVDAADALSRLLAYRIWR